MRYRVFLLSVVLMGSAAWGAYVQSGAAGEMALSARTFLTSLSPQLQKQASFDFADEERFNWHYIPRARKGVSFRDLDAAQRKLGHAFIASGLSSDGYLKMARIMYLEELLYEMESARNREGSRERRHPDGYFFSVFGEPSDGGAWGWRLEGHHLSLNFSLREGKVISATPMFWGANPATAKQGPQAGLRALASEELVARELLHSFEGSARRAVIISSEAPSDIITRASQIAEMGRPEGIPMKDMNRQQSELMTELLKIYVHSLRSDVAEAEWGKIQKAGMDDLYFAWAGGTEAGEPHYYRIQSPEFVIEYDNTQNNANHIHAVWRDFKNDFGRDLLKEHYRESHRR